MNDGFDDYEFEEHMQFPNIGVAMLRCNIILGSKNSVFMTQNACIFVDAQVLREERVVIAGVDVMVPGFGFYLVKGVDNATNASKFVGKCISNGPRNKKEKIGIKMFTQLLYGRIAWD